MKTNLLEAPELNKVVSDLSPYLFSKIQEIKSLDIYNKNKMYLNYCINNIALKHNFEIVDSWGKNWNIGWGDVYEKYNNISFFYLWKNQKVMSFEDFFSLSNIEIEDLGENYKENGYARRWFIQYYGAYDWFIKSENKINITHLE